MDHGDWGNRWQFRRAEGEKVKTLKSHDIKAQAIENI